MLGGPIEYLTNLDQQLKETERLLPRQFLPAHPGHDNYTVISK
jgi:hypothetical protein